jgi:hypothetical protein
MIGLEGRRPPPYPLLGWLHFTHTREGGEMPRERFDDQATEGLSVQVSWRKPDDDGTGNPGYVQISTHDEQHDARVVELLDAGRKIMAALVDTADLEEQPSRDLAWLYAEWCWKISPGGYRAELTGSYVTLDARARRELLKTLHKADRQAEPGQNQIDVRDPLGGVVSTGQGGFALLPGATGYPLRESD